MTMVMQYAPGLLLLVVAFTYHGTTGTADYASVQETCLMKTFEAQCVGNNVIVMKTALFGRMQPSRCIKGTDGEYGCGADVLAYFDEHCSGKHECRLLIPNTELLALNNCPEGQFPYLKTSFDCIPVLPDSLYRDSCQRDGVVTLTGYTEGVIASSSVFSSDSRSRLCPVIIQAKTGQNINVTLLDFNSYRNTAPSSTTCRRYATLKERSVTRPTTVCGGRGREQNVYISKSNQLEIQFMNSQGSDMEPKFLMRFSTFGCPDPDLNGHDLLEKTPEMARVYCSSSGQNTQLYCRGNKWSSELIHCDTNTDYFPEGWSTLQGLIITLCVGIVIGMALGFIVLCGICFCIKRRSRPKQPRQIVYYEGNARWNAGKRIDNWELNNGTISRDMDYNPRAKRRNGSSVYEPVYDPIHPDSMMVETKDLPRRFDTINRNIFTELPPPPLPTELPDDSEHPYAKPV